MAAAASRDGGTLGSELREAMGAGLCGEVKSLALLVVIFCVDRHHLCIFLHLCPESSSLRGVGKREQEKGNRGKGGVGLERAAAEAGETRGRILGFSKEHGPSHCGAKSRNWPSVAPWVSFRVALTFLL